jgi:transcriptional regulator with XRE-family HTH domain
VRFHCARHLLKLRRYREQTQASLAKVAGTSQAKIARIESGSENITLDTLRRHIEALRGRFCLSIAPEEMELPRVPNWWQMLDDDGSPSQWNFRGVKVHIHAEGKTAEATWTCDENSESVALAPISSSSGIGQVVAAEFRLT